MPAAPTPMVSGEVQPQAPPCDTASSTPTRPPASSPMPGQSIGPLATAAVPRGTQASTIAADTRIRIAPRMKIHRHDSTSTTIPPTTRARPAPSPIMPGIQPKAAARRGPFRVDRASARASGKVAVPTPCRARAMSSTPRFGATAARRVAAANTIIEMSMTRRWPKRSPSLPTTGEKTAPASRNAVRIHPVPRLDAPSSLPIVGSAGTTRVCMSENASTAALSAKVNRPG